jgi:phosphoglycolate phosphatase
MVGDTTFDVQMALAAGSGALGVAWGYHPADSLWQAGAHHVTADCTELERTLDTLLLTKEPS